MSGQTEPPTSKRAARGYLSYSNYRQALEEYKKLHAKDSLNIEYNHSIGLCYLETNIDKSKAIPYLEWVTSQIKCSPGAWYDLGRAYAANYRFDEAISAFSKFKTLIPKDENYVTADRQIEMCQNAKEMIKHPQNVIFTNLGIEINSEAPDFNPYITSDETFLVYSTKRTGNIGGWLDYDGFNTSDIMFSQSRRGVWQKPKRLPNSINSPIIEETVGMSPDGSHMFVYMENYTATGDVYLSVKAGRSFNKVDALGPNVNTKNLETSACIAPNKKTLFFTSMAAGGMGGSDIYYCHKLPNGQWGVPINAGPSINTIHDEEFPYIAPDGKTFYFSSNGHNSMGGFDLFKCTWDKTDMSFSGVQNLGYPINTPDDEFTISVSKSGRYAYISAFRDDSFGDLDLYRITFQNIPPPLHFISGKIMHSDSSNIFSLYEMMVTERNQIRQLLDSLQFNQTPEDSIRIEYENPGIFMRLTDLEKETAQKPEITITVKEKVTGETIGIYRPNNNSGRYVIILPPGNYIFTYEGKGFQTEIREMSLPDNETTSEEMILHVTLSKT